MGSRPVGLSGSRGAAILGLSKWATPLQIWQLIQEERRSGFNAERGYEMPPPVDNAAVRWGLAFESAVVSLAIEHHGAGTIVGREELWAVVDGKPYGYDLSGGGLGANDVPITCHIDGRYTEGGASPGGTLHEGKTTALPSFWDDWGEPGSDRVPQNYQLQVQHQMLCTGASSCIVSVLVWPRRPDEWEAAGIELVQALGRGDELEWHVRRREGLLTGEFVDHPETNKREFKTHAFATPCLHWARMLDELGYFHQYTIPASPTLQAELVRAYTEWWTAYVLGEKEPEPRNWDDVRRLCPAPKGTVVADKQASRWALEFREIGEEIGGTGRLAKRRDELKLLILQWMRAQDAAVDDDSREKTVLRDAQGKKLAQWNGEVFRT